MAEAQRMSRRMWIQVAVSLFVLAASVVLSLLAVRFLKSDQATAADPVTVPLVKAVAARPHPGGLTIEADGVVVPYREITLSAEVAGRIAEQAAACRAGRYVRAGELLLVIDPSDYQLALEQAEKEEQQAAVALSELEEQIKGLGEQIEVATAELALRRRELKRQQDLKGVVSSVDLERAEANELAARNNLVSLQNRLRVAEISRSRLESARELAQRQQAKAQLDLDRTRVTAPVDGVVVQEQVEQDTYVQRGTPLVTLEDTSKVEVKCKLAMEDLFWLWDGQQGSAAAPAPATPATAYAMPDASVEVVYRIAGRPELEYVWQGRLDRFDGIGVDERTRTVPCRVVVDDPLQRRSRLAAGPPALVRGMYVTVRVHAQPATPLFQLPAAALRPGNVVWRVRNRKLAIVPLQVAGVAPAGAGGSGEAAPAGTLLVYVDDPSQLRADDLVVVSPLSLVRSGMEVRLSAPAAALEDRK